MSTELNQHRPFYFLPYVLLGIHIIVGNIFSSDFGLLSIFNVPHYSRGLGAFLIFWRRPTFVCATIAEYIKTTTISSTLNYYHYFASHMCVGFPARGRVSFIKVCKSRGGAVGFNLGTKPAAERQRHPLLIHLSKTWESMNLRALMSKVAHFF